MTSVVLWIGSCRSCRTVSCVGENWSQAADRRGIGSACDIWGSRLFLRDSIHMGDFHSWLGQNARCITNHDHHDIRRDIGHGSSIHSLLSVSLKNLRRTFFHPDEWQSFIEAVNAAYHEFDTDRNMLERSLDLSSRIASANST